MKPYAYKRAEPAVYGPVTPCLLHNEPASHGRRRWLTATRRVAAAKASPNRALSRRLWTRNPVIYPRSGRGGGNTPWRTEPVNVEKFSDEPGVGVKGQSNREIARTPRNVFRNSVALSLAAR